MSVTPAGVREYQGRGHQVLVQRSAGEGSGFADGEYAAAGAELVDSAAEIFDRAEMIVKVKEPVPAEYDLLRPEQVLFTYLHLAANAPLTRRSFAITFRRSRTKPCSSTTARCRS